MEQKLPTKKIWAAIALFCAIVIGGIKCSQHNTLPTTAHHLYDLSSIKGRVVGGLYCMYLDTCGVLPASTQSVPAEKLKRMWGFKIGRYPGRPAIRNVAHTLMEEYRTHTPTRMSLRTYRGYVSDVLRDTKGIMSWERLARVKKVGKKRLPIFRNICRTIRERDLLAYALTELMPSDDGELNLKVLEIILKTDGREFIESIPAMGDGLVSFGPYQFTSKALSHTPKGITDTCVVNQTLPKLARIPESVAFLRSKDHYRAAYLFSVANVANLVRSLTDKQAEALKRKQTVQWPSVMQYIAVAHHGPSAARRFAKAWLNDDAVFEYAAYCSPHYKQYAKKTAANYAALGR